MIKLTRIRVCLALLSLLLVVAGLPPATPVLQADARHQLFLPLTIGLPPPPNPFGFDVRSYMGSSVLEHVRLFGDAMPRWSRAGDVSWDLIEPVRGGGYHWDKLRLLDNNIKRLRELGIEPIVVVYRTPRWAQRVPGRACSPPKPEYLADYARFITALVKRHREGPLAVRYWEIWNEPDVHPAHNSDDDGTGCLFDEKLPYNGGSYYGQMLQRIYPVIKQVNPQAQVLAGALLYNWPNDDASRTFLKGLLEQDRGRSFDMLSFHAYGEWGAGDLLLSKTHRIRALLAEYGLQKKPLFASETAATCRSDLQSDCPPNFDHWTNYEQAQFAARIYAEAIALDLEGALWYTLTQTNPGFRYSHLIDLKDNRFTPRPAYWAILNSAKLLRGATYIGPPVVEPPLDQPTAVQVLPFRKAGSALYVLWAPRIFFPEPPLPYSLDVRPGTRATCTVHLDNPKVLPYNCSDSDSDGKIDLAINGLPMYVEIPD